MVPLTLLPPGALAQLSLAPGGNPGGYLAAPSLPSTLPGGLPLPSLSSLTQQEILQRILDGGAPRPATQPPPFAPPPPAPPPYAPAPEEPLSPAEAFFAARAPANPRPLRQFGYDNLRGGAPQGQSFGILPDDYLLGRDDEVVLAFRGRARQTLTLRIGRDGNLLIPDLPPIPAAGRTLRELRGELETRAQRDLGGSEVFVSLSQLRQIGVFVGGEVMRPGLQALTSLSSVLDALVAAGGIRRTGSLRAIRVEGPGGRRSIDLYPVIAGEGTTPELRLREGERILVPPLGAVAAIGGEVTRPAIYELPAGTAQAPLAAMLRLAGDPLRPSGNRFLLQTTDAEGRRSLREIGPRDPLRRGDALRVEPGSDVVAQDLRLAGHVVTPLLRAAGGRGQTLRGLLSDPRLVRADPYARLGVIWRTDADLSTVEFAREPSEQSSILPLSRTLLDLRSRNFAAVRLSPRDVVRLPRGFGDRDLGPVTLVGEFLRPGIYDIRRGERLSEVIARAGGLTPQAYPYGAVFSRDSVRQRQQDGFQRTARELEQGLMQVAAGQAVAGLRGQTDLGGAINAGQALAATLRQTRAAGRMVVEANPVVLAGRPDLDVLMEPGDLVAMPKRPNEVTVVGAVLNPGSLQFATGWKAAEYIRAAGGEQRFADGGRAFVVLPNGQSAPAGLGMWQTGGPPIPPGSVVVVPQDPSPYEGWGALRDITQVLSQIALSSAALAVIVRSSGR